jgi:hypothetical protein
MRGGCAIFSHLCDGPHGGHVVRATHATHIVVRDLPKIEHLRRQFPNLYVERGK